MMIGRSDHSGSLLADGRVLVSGGEGNIDSTEIYDPSTGEWSPGPKLNVSRNRHMQITMQDGSVLITGGQGPEKMSVVVEYFKPNPVETLTGGSSGATQVVRLIDLTNFDDAGFADNDDFELAADDILDFTDKNPFGDP